MEQKCENGGTVCGHNAYFNLYCSPQSLSYCLQFTCGQPFGNMSLKNQGTEQLSTTPAWHPGNYDVNQGFFRGPSFLTWVINQPSLSSLVLFVHICRHCHRIPELTVLKGTSGDHQIQFPNVLIILLRKTSFYFFFLWKFISLKFLSLGNGRDCKQKNVLGYTKERASIPRDDFFHPIWLWPCTEWD